MLKVNHTDPSVIVMNKNTKSQLLDIDEVFSFDWNSKGKILYYSDAETNVKNGSKVNYFKSVNIDTMITEEYYRDDNNAIWIQPIVTQDDRVMIHVFNDYRTVKILSFDPLTKVTNLISEGGKCDVPRNDRNQRLLFR